MFDKCRRCGRRLWSAKSREVGYGRFCMRKLQKVIDQIGAKEHQVGRALDLMETDGIVEVPTRHDTRLFRVVSSSGETLYRTTPNLCTCPAGQADTMCYHRVAVALVLA